MTLLDMWWTWRAKESNIFRREGLLFFVLNKLGFRKSPCFLVTQHTKSDSEKKTRTHVAG